MPLHNNQRSIRGLSVLGLYDAFRVPAALSRRIKADDWWADQYMSLSVHLRCAAPGNVPQLILESVNQDGERRGEERRGEERRRACPISGPPRPPVTMTTAVDGGGWGGGRREVGGACGAASDRCCWWFAHRLCARLAGWELREAPTQPRHRSPMCSASPHLLSFFT